MTDEFTAIERRVLSRIQWHFPLAESPYDSLARDLDCGRDAVLSAVRGMRRQGVIRRIGGSFAPQRLGYVSALVAGRVEPSCLAAAGELAASFPEVTHDYERQDRFNLWFTVIAASRQRRDDILASVRACDGVRELHPLPATKTFKLKVNFTFEDGAPEDLREHAAAEQAAGSRQPAAPDDMPPYPLDALDRLIISRCGGDIGDSEQPFAALADGLGIPETTLLERLTRYRAAGVLRRFGAILRHQAAGFVANGMSAWNVPAADVDRVGALLAEFPEVSHCYERPRFAGWPYNLFAMIHGRSRQACLDTAQRAAEKTGMHDYNILFSGREFKKTSMVYGEAG